MVCEKCEKKLGKVIVPDKWKEGASNTTEGGGRKINENKLLSKKNSDSEIDCFADGLLMELPSASSASSKYTKMASTVTLVLTLKAYVQCAVSKCWTPSFTNKAMYDMEKITLFYFSLVLLLAESRTVPLPSPKSLYVSLSRCIAKMPEYHSLVEHLEFQYFSISSAVLPGILPAIKDHLNYDLVVLVLCCRRDVDESKTSQWNT
ncbi:hypothetical protein RHGRI_004421 [Rhododendron griersonianum]|uniref:Cysteine-rich PDZ-binding protein n=1 Tax=Rhododendron griersonianum TaxID=479676 RepID=A0AAV6LB95_9ERIC|nr:hypothetical protein RHGRI_004421 [Rhododendron griersonianum]